MMLWLPRPSLAGRGSATFAAPLASPFIENLPFPRGGGAAIPTGDPVAKQSSKADVVAFCVWKSETPLRWLEVTKSLDVAGMVAWHCT